jgi:hypothetical protein
MMNAKQEFLRLIEGKNVLCAEIRRLDSWTKDDDGEEDKVFSLSVGYTENDWDDFIESLDFHYDNGYGLQEVDGTIWFTDNSWAERDEYDGSEWWAVKKRPNIPAALITDALNQWGISQSESEENLNP